MSDKITMEDIIAAAEKHMATPDFSDAGKYVMIRGDHWSDLQDACLRIENENARLTRENEQLKKDLESEQEKTLLAQASQRPPSSLHLLAWRRFLSWLGFCD